MDFPLVTFPLHFISWKCPVYKSPLYRSFLTGVIKIDFQPFSP